MHLRRTIRNVSGTTYHDYLPVEPIAIPKGPHQHVRCSLDALARGPKDVWLARRLTRYGARDTTHDNGLLWIGDLARVRGG